jgi:hypothetical protein
MTILMTVPAFFRTIGSDGWLIVPATGCTHVYGTAPSFFFLHRARPFSFADFL